MAIHGHREHHDQPVEYDGMEYPILRQIHMILYFRGLARNSCKKQIPLISLDSFSKREHLFLYIFSIFYIYPWDWQIKATIHRWDKLVIWFFYQISCQPWIHTQVSWDPYYSQYMENNPNVPNHQPVMIVSWLAIIFSIEKSGHLFFGIRSVWLVKSTSHWTVESHVLATSQSLIIF